ncbi:MAG: dockerin type I repeat-containing protein [candidate division Zixibacteria bacterium]|nr:dockerin type I repeat-containing protein [candidate division Zixibacteria bacterium]
MASDTHFVAMDLTDVQLGTMQGGKAGSTLLRAPLGVEPSPFILWRNDVTHQSGVRIMTLDRQSGAQMGSRLNVGFLKSWYPVDVLWGQHFAAPVERGVEPSPWIVFRDYRLYTFPVSYGLDGTPLAGSPETFSPAVDSTVYGHATCATELPGSEFGDGKARLFIGTDQGYIVVLASTMSGGIVITDILPISSVPIDNLQPLPQCGYIALGTLTGNVIKGVRYYPNSPNLFAVIFALTDPRTPVLEDLDSFGSDDTELPDCLSTLRLVLANGSTDLALATIAAGQTGTATMSPTLDPHEVGIKSAVTGSLLMLATNESAVTFDPYYSQQTGSSGCDVNVTDAIPDQCTYVCGDANADAAVDISDAVSLITYIFSGGPAPTPLQAGDANCDSTVDISDAVYLISYIFSGGPAPCAGCK